LNYNNTATNTTIRLHAQGLSFSWGTRQALSNVSLDLNAGEMFGLLGPNGAGKTTTLRMLLGIIDPDEGERCLLGSSDPISKSHQVGYLPEERGLYQSTLHDRGRKSVVGGGPARIEQGTGQSQPGASLLRFSDSTLVESNCRQLVRRAKKAGRYCARHGAQTGSINPG